MRFIKINYSWLLFHICALRKLHVRGGGEGGCWTISEMFTFPHQLKLLNATNWCRVANNMFEVLCSAPFNNAMVCVLGSMQTWDWRCLSTGEHASILTGHLHGITHIDSQRDGWSFISNGKDQAMKLWDIRKMMLNAERYCSFTI
jgi:WD40 repeat protein